MRKWYLIHAVESKEQKAVFMVCFIFVHSMNQEDQAGRCTKEEFPLVQSRLVLKN